MKNITIVMLLLLGLTISACSPNAAPTPIPTVVLNSKPSASSGGVSASGQIVPKLKAQLSFPLTGTVKAVAVETGDQVTKGQTLVALDTALWEAKVKEAEANVVAAQANERFIFRTTGADQEHLDAANADIESAQAVVDSAKATLAQATLTAPFNGTIASVDISPAETVTPGQEVIMLGDLTSFQVETTDLSERDAPLVQVGQTASISVQALGKEFPAKVVDVSRISSTVGGDVVYKVTLQFDTQPQGLLWGMTTDVNIQTK